MVRLFSSSSLSLAVPIDSLSSSDSYLIYSDSCGLPSLLIVIESIDFKSRLMSCLGLDLVDDVYLLLLHVLSFLIVLSTMFLQKLRFVECGSYWLSEYIIGGLCVVCILHCLLKSCFHLYINLFLSYLLALFGNRLHHHQGAGDSDAVPRTEPNRS